MNKSVKLNPHLHNVGAKSFLEDAKKYKDTLRIELCVMLKQQVEACKNDIFQLTAQLLSHSDDVLAWLCRGLRGQLFIPV